MAALALRVGGGLLAAERHTNGLGGGLWTDPGSWHGQVSPAATDVVVIASGDTLQADAGEAVCAGLLIDPDGVLAARPAGTPRRLLVTGPVESYGLIRVDAAREPQAAFTLRVEAAEPGARVIRLHRNSGLLLYGPASPEAGAPGVSLEAGAPGGADAAGAIEAGPGVRLDLAGVRVLNWAVKATGLDNTGFKPDERLNLASCRFEGFGRIELKECDSALVAGNRLEWRGTEAALAPAVSASSCKLGDLRQNRVTGRFPAGFDLASETDPAVTSNTVEGAEAGFSFRSCANPMIRANAALGCGDGLRIAGGSGAVEGLRVRGVRRGVVLTECQVQVSDARIEDTPDGAAPVHLESASVALLNVNVTTNQIRRSGRAPAGKEPWATQLHYLVVKAAGAFPPGSEVAVATAAASGGPPGGLADLNVRNSPARILANGLTPLPRTLRPLVVRGWRIDNAGVFREAPFYDLKVTGAPDPATGARPVLKAQVVEPRENWYRPEPDAPAPTLEVTR